jgi:hypothetical protein
LPVAVIGSFSTNSISRGYSCAASLFRTKLPIGGSEKGVIDDLNDRFEDFSEIYAYTNKKRK